jgi:hypothetical protein
MEKLISILVWLDMKLYKCTHKQWTGIGGYWIAYGKIDRKRGIRNEDKRNHHR